MFISEFCSSMNVLQRIILTVSSLLLLNTAIRGQRSGGGQRSDNPAVTLSPADIRLPEASSRWTGDIRAAAGPQSPSVRGLTAPSRAAAPPTVTGSWPASRRSWPRPPREPASPDRGPPSEPGGTGVRRTSPCLQSGWIQPERRKCLFTVCIK